LAVKELLQKRMEIEVQLEPIWNSVGLKLNDEIDIAPLSVEIVARRRTEDGKPLYMMGAAEFRDLYLASCDERLHRLSSATVYLSRASLSVSVVTTDGSRQPDASNATRGRR
jgi:hypothetical protein